jgi:hypothetical protein
MKIFRILVIAGVATGAVCVLALWLLGRGLLGHPDSADITPTGPPRSAAEVKEAGARVARASVGVNAAEPNRQILFGDLHVHTTISFDAFTINMPAGGGQGAHPPADACDFARHCAALDFWSINDHASNILPEDWKQTVEGIRQCNELAGDPENPDTVAFLGWEWTQAGLTPETHYGHKNVVLAGIEDDEIPTRPIAANFGGLAAYPPSSLRRGLAALRGGRYHDMALRWTDISESDVCPDGNSRNLANDCIEIAPTPDVLFRKLDEWDNDAIVIPHGTTWGIYTPPGSTWDKQLSGDFYDPERQTLIEVYSGHGDGEVYRNWRAVERNPDGTETCPEDRPDFTPMCQMAGRIIEKRCLDEGTDSAECAERAEQGRRNAATAGLSPHITVPGATPTDWLDAGQCRDCDQPAFKYRPGSSAQYIHAISNFDEGDENPRRFRMGFIAASDIHTARPGTGYKELRALSESPDRKPLGSANSATSSAKEAPAKPDARSQTYEEAVGNLKGVQLYETERVRSMLYTGGLAAVHADGRDRKSIWEALKRNEVYGTSGTRMLMWFDLIGEGGATPMGSEVETPDTPIFRVRAVGSFEQAPGCPARAIGALGPDEIERLCRGECYSPTDSRRPITRIELVRIRPQNRPYEGVAGLIDDPWQTFECSGDPLGCTATFADPEYEKEARDTVYYARAFEAAIDTVNGDPLSCEYDENGACVETTLCAGGNDCLAPHEPRAWSSPIFVDYPR